ncbi:MAG: flavodoxin family protein [Firmicutes bacterium]|nr:flavodoxin family protein [Bacillota bacterium]
MNGSPHKNGCTYTALSEVANALEKEGIETEIFWIGIKPIAGCIACGNCERNGKCVFDDVVNECREKAKDFNGFVFGSPVHYASAGGAITSFMDRLFFSDMYISNSDTFRLKPAACVVSARRSGTTATFDQLNKYFTINEMPIVSSRYWNMVHGMTPEEVMQDKEGLAVMRTLGKNMAYMLKCIDAAEKAGVPLPKREEPVSTNFIR